MLHRRRKILSALVVVSSAAACADVFGFKDLTAGDASVDAQFDAPNACAQRTVDDAKGVFVTLNGGDTSTCGSRNEPCQTIQTGVNQAKLLGRSTVYVARGTYTESIQLAAGTTIEGGWDTASTTWIPACDTTEVSAVKVVMPSSANVAVTANFSGSAGLRLLSVIGKSTAQPGESIYGVFANGPSLTLDTISVNVGSGGEGSQGPIGDAGAKGSIDCDASDGATGASPGHSGAGAPEGTFGPTGWTSSTGGPGSADGSAGAPGDCTISSSCITTCTTCLSICVNALAGCGGAPGLGGGGGASGGSSIAVFGWDAKITVIGGSFQSGNGGNGGNGGAGGPGGAGGAGGVQNATCMSACTVDAGCATVGNQSPQIGGTGGSGASGGQGGGGAGGASYVFFNGGDAGSVTLTGSPAFIPGDAGQGGTVGGPPGKSAAQGP
jgi:hypothetical protein